MPTARTRVVREADRAVYDRETVYRILDEGFLCHAGFVVDGQPFVIPTSYGRKDASLYIHGSAASRMLRQMQTAGQRRRARLHHRDPARRAGTGPLRFQSLHELPLGGDSGKGHAGGRPGRKAGGPAHSVGTHSARPLGRLAPAQRTRTQSHVGAARAHRRILRESPHRPGPSTTRKITRSPPGPESYPWRWSQARRSMTQDCCREKKRQDTHATTPASAERD